MTVLCSSSSDKSLLLSDGSRLAIEWPSWDQCLFFDGFHVTELQCEMHQNIVDVMAYGDRYPVSMSTGRSITLDLRIRCGQMEQLPLKEAHKLFRTAESMSVNDLLAVAFQKMNERDQ
jgi:hypothetical protein